MDFVEGLFDLVVTLLERALDEWGIEDHVFNFHPLVVSVLSAHDAHGFLKICTTCPELAVEAQINGETFFKPLRWVK